jgi:hypothetical protein
MKQSVLRLPVWILLGAFLLQSCTPATMTNLSSPAIPPSLTLILLGDSAPLRNTPIEFAIGGVPEVTNPFDAAEADLQINLVAPNGITTIVDGFWYQGYTADGRQPTGEAGWHARFTPTISGEWQVSALFRPANLSSNELQFTVSDSDNPGFIHVDPNHPHYFAYDNGTRFLPIAVNMAWWNDDPIKDYTRWLDHFAANGGNTIRVWMADWSFGIEWNDTGLGDYRPRMRQAWLLDKLFRLADERGVKIILVLNHHGQFSQTVNPIWDENPYNADLGGPLDSPGEFASDPTAIAFFQRRLRYITARWGAAPDLLAWEWWNEYNYTPISDEEMESWLQLMDPFLTAHDPYNHLTTISGPANAHSPVWHMPAIDFVSLHTYTTIDPWHIAVVLTREYAPVVRDKPLLLAEYGFSAVEENAQSYDKTGIQLHNGIWATIFRGQAGTGMYWWWDSYLEPLNLWHHFGALARFFEGVDPANFTPTTAIVGKEDGTPTEALGMLLKSENQDLLWVRSNHYTAAALNDAHTAAARDALRNRETLKDFDYIPPPLSGHVVHMFDIEPGNYEIHWYDPQSGEWGAVDKAQAVDEELIISLPTFSQDIAAQITRSP